MNDLTAPPDSVVSHPPYQLRISRLTIDKLGVKLYDKVSAVVAELVANSYDADAEVVEVKLPLSTLLGSEDQADGGYVIEVSDDGHGMIPQEAIDCFLKVGRDRRSETGGRSRSKKRSVMGRKGIGKLAPFGICERMEVISSGGVDSGNGFLTSHFYIDYQTLCTDTETPVLLPTGPYDGQYRPKPGTTIRLSQFRHKRVPDPETFHRQIATRFVFAEADFGVKIVDLRDPGKNKPRDVSPVSVSTLPRTKIDLAKHPVVTEDGETLAVTGWLAMAKEPYKNEELAGVRIYARNKIVATTRDFEQPAGFTGEFAVRSYLVGQVHAEWLDLDDGEDLVRSDRQGILWDSDYGRALRKWGAGLIKAIAKAGKKPREERKREKFLSRSNIGARAKEMYGKSSSVAATAVQIAKQIGGFAAEDELGDEDYVSDLSDFILSIAPHKALIESFRQLSEKVHGGSEVPLEDLVELFGQANLAELASYGQIAAERVQAIRQLEEIIDNRCEEAELQTLISRAPWLIEPTWSAITKNESLRTFKRRFEVFYKQRTGAEITLEIATEKTSKRPDFTLASIGGKLRIVEIKRPEHAFDDDDAGRLLNYFEKFDEFFRENATFGDFFRGGYEITLVADKYEPTYAIMRSIKSFEDEGKFRRITWSDFLIQARTAHEAFLDAQRIARAHRAETEPGEGDE